MVGWVPIVDGLIGALGNSFAFLMGGVVTDYTELGALWSNIGRRTASSGCSS